jgi:hypothetical protein
MGICRFCKLKAGWFRDVHPECAARVAKGMKEITATVQAAVASERTFSDVRNQVMTIAKDCLVPKDKMQRSMIDGWSNGAEQRSRSTALSDVEANSIRAFLNDAGVPDEDFATKTSGSFAIYYSNMTWCVLHDRIRPLRYDEGTLRSDHYPIMGGGECLGLARPESFNLQPGEIALAMLANVYLKQETTSRPYKGHYGGVSIRVASGLWYRFGTVNGLDEEISSIQDVDGGEVLISNHAMYFSGRMKGLNLKIPYSQVIRFKPYSNAIGICRNGSREQIFAPKVGRWSDGVLSGPDNFGVYLFNLLQALASKDSARSY